MRSILKALGISFLLVIFISCVCRSEEYCHFYTHLKKLRTLKTWATMQESDFFLIILVNARHLDYTQNQKFFKSIAKHPSDATKTRDVGHAWIYLQGKKNGKIIKVEGGHSGEIEEFPARYFDGMMNYNDWGYANPTCEQCLCPRYEPNPVKYLWTIRTDGFFQKGSGGHRPTFAAKIDLTSDQFERILSFIHPCHYAYQYYSLIEHQCSSFVAQVAALANWNLEFTTTMSIAPQVYYGRKWIRLWENPCYSCMTFASPDVLEKSLIQAVENGEAEYALDWYLYHFPK